MATDLFARPRIGDDLQHHWNRMIAWHYTTGEKFRLIIACGELRPMAESSQDRAILWFSLNQQWEPTASKMRKNADGSLTPLTREQAYQLGNGLVRFGFPSARCIPWWMLGKKARIPFQTRVRLEYVGRKLGADPQEWCGVTHPISVDRLIIEVFKKNEWVRVREARGWP